MLARDLIPAYYCTPDRFSELSRAEKESRRKKTCNLLGLSPEKTVIAFLGKLIPRKDLGLLLEAVEHVPPDLRDRIAFLFVSSGELESKLQERVNELRKTTDITVVFTGFINQMELPNCYLSADTTVLPSYKMRHETWW